jgi:leucyl aminopeptidase
VQVHFILPATENMVDGNATRPSDIVSASNGKTVEVSASAAVAARQI